MEKLKSIRPEVVKRIPKVMAEGVLYISEEFETAAHNCCCGCGIKIITPLKAGKWRLTKSNGRVSLHPSIGNWSSACQSHYVISGNEIKWARGFTSDEVRSNREHDKQVSAAAHIERELQKIGIFSWIWQRIKRLLGL